MDLDDVYVQIGEFGLQQKIYFISLSLFNLYAPFHLVQTVFTGTSTFILLMTFYIILLEWFKLRIFALFVL